MAGRDQKATDREVLAAVNSHPDPVVVAKDLVPHLAYKSTDGVRNRLNKLSEDGLLHKRMVGARSAIYWLSDDGRALLREASGEA